MDQKSKEYKQINKFLSAFSILSHSDGATVIASENNTYLVRNISISNSYGKQKDEEINEIINTLSQHQTFNSKNILSLVDFEIIFNKTKTERQIRAVYEYGQKSLSKQIQDRKYSEEYFDQDALWGLLYSITSPLAYLQERSIIYGVIDASRIFLDNNIIAILDPSSTGIDPYQITANRIYSPDLLKGQQYLEEVNMFKSDVFALGLLMLQCALLKMELYEYDDNILKICLSEIKDIYSQGFSQLIESMLDFQSQSRPSFAQILKSISNMFEISSSEIQTLEPMGPDRQNQCNQICELDQYNEKQTIDILETEYIRLEDCHHPLLNDFQKSQLRFYHSKDSQFNQSPIDQSSEFSESGSLFIDESMVKSFQKSRRIYKPRQIKEKLIVYHTEVDRTQKVQSDQFQQADFHRRSKTNWENQWQNSKQSNKIHKEDMKRKSHKKNNSHHHDFSSKTMFSPLNKQNLFTKPEIMNMIKDDIKKIQDRKKSFMNVNFSYLPQDESRNSNQFMKNKQNNEKIDKHHLTLHQASVKSHRR